MKQKQMYCPIGAVAMALMLAAGTVGAAEQEPTAAGMRGHKNFIERFDQDNDGRVAIEEFPSVETQFQHMDTNGDGYIDATEVPRPPRPPVREMLARFDADGDGLLSLAELKAGGPRGGPARDDNDGDGRVSADEFSGPEDVFERLDENGDGYIDKSEGRPRRMHAQAD